ncbi:hypothetical protein [Nocardiopsis alba]|uniref:hypothetical protein n=1 Tax=Nocardiopsis alba TaxID=53437 RepID=UPI0035DDD418
MQPDRRRVQTAVTGNPDSSEPAYMPTDADEADEFKALALAKGHTHWCGTLLGGCGGRLTLKIIRERETVPHFAHRGDSNLCARLAGRGGATLGGESADHLYAQRHVRHWLSHRDRATPGVPEYVGLAPGKACTEVVIPLGGSESLRIVLTSDLDHELLEIARSPIARDYVWLVRANDALTTTLFRSGVPYRRVRLVSELEYGRAIEVGLPDGTGDTVWTPLAQCVLSEGTLHRAPNAASPTPSQPRRDSSSISAVAPDPLEQAVYGLNHAINTGEPRGAINTWAQLVRRQLRVGRERGITHDLAVEARAALDRAAEATGGRRSSLAPDATRRTVARAMAQHQRYQDRRQKQDEQQVQRERQKRDERQVQRERQHREIARQVRRVVGKLDWAKAYERPVAYRENLVKLREFLERPEVPPDIIDQVNGYLSEFPEDLFTRKNKSEKRPKRRSGRRKDGGRRDGRGRIEKQPERPAPQPRIGLEVQAIIDDRSREILESIRASGSRPTPRVPPPDRW